MKATAIGIDLGTTYCCMAIVEKGKPIIIDSEQGSRTMPSYVSFGDEVTIGEDAKEEMEDFIGKTVYDAKRLIGKEFDNPEVQKDIDRFSFKVIPINNKPVVEVDNNGKTLHFKPEEISSLILEKMRKRASLYVGSEVKDVVITVPAHFGTSQRQATMDAGKMAGFNVLQIVSEPIAAAVAYGFNKVEAGKSTVLVYDLGGGTLDVTVLIMSDNTHFKVLATAGNPHLGGEDFDNRMVDALSEMYKKTHKKDLTKNAMSMLRLKAHCEKKKHNLSAKSSVRISLPRIHDNNDIKVDMSRNWFEDMCNDLFENTLNTVKEALEHAGLDKSSIDEVVVTGGSTRIPKVQQLLQDFFGKPLVMHISQDEAVAIGAALLASKWSNLSTASKIKSMEIIDVTPLSIGLRASGGLMFPMIKRNTSIPTSREHEFLLPENAKSICIEVYEGERALVADNRLLGKISLEELKPARHLENSYRATFKIDVNGILTVSAKEKLTHRFGKLEISDTVTQKDQAETETMLREAEENKEEHDIISRRNAARQEMEDYAYKMKYAAEDAGNVLCDDDKEKVRILCDETIEWLQTCKDLEVEEFMILKRGLDLRRRLSPIMKNFGTST